LLWEKADAPFWKCPELETAEPLTCFGGFQPRKFVPSATGVNANYRQIEIEIFVKNVENAKSPDPKIDLHEAPDDLRRARALLRHSGKLTRFGLRREGKGRCR
jgi:hypothetical protein